MFFGCVFLAGLHSITYAAMTSVVTGTASDATVIKTRADAKGSEAEPDFRGTWFASFPLPALEEVIRNWVTTELKPEDVINDHRITGRAPGSTGLVPDQHASVLLGMPTPPDDEKLTALAAFPAPRIRIGPLACFPPKRVEVDGVTHEYCVLHVALLPPEPSPAVALSTLPGLQRVLGAMFPEPDGTLRKWHHPTYHPHATIAFIRADAVTKYVGRSIGLSGDGPLEISPTQLIFKAFRDKSIPPIVVPLRLPRLWRAYANRLVVRSDDIVRAT